MFGNIENPIALEKEKSIMVALQDNALLLARALLGQKSSTCCVFEDLTNTLVGLCRTLKILVCTNLLANLLTLFGSNGLLASLVELFNGLLVITQILLTTHENDRETTAEMEYFGDPLLLNVIERVGGVDSKANQNDVRIWV